jgi:hypothetical protein
MERQCRWEFSEVLPESFPFDVPAAASFGGAVPIFMPAPRTRMYLDYTQLVLLSAASLRDDGAIESSHDLRNGTARTAVERLLSVGLIEEMPAGGSHMI